MFIILFLYFEIISGGNTTKNPARTIKSNLYLSKVSINLDLVGAFTKGFLEETKDIITKEEIALLFYGYYIITLELGMRFLTDYLDGDKYFALSEEQKKKRPKINLERARNQLKLVLEIEKNQIKLENIIDQTLIQLGYERNKDE